MKQRLLLALCATVLFAACSDGNSGGSEELTAPGIVAFSHQGGTHVCTFKDAYTFAKNYLATNTDRNAARGYLQTAEGAGVGSVTRNDALFDLLELIATAQNSGNTNLALDGAKLVGEVVDCGGSGWKMSDGRAFLDVTANALTTGQGGFAVVGAQTFGDANAEYAFSEDGVFAFGFNDYNAAADSWAGTFGRAVVILANVGSQPFGLPIEEGLGYRVNLIFAELPADWGDDQLAAEFCSTGQVVLPAAQPQHRIGRISSSGDAALQEGDIDGFCQAGINAMNEPSPAASQGSLLARMVDQVIGFFRPAPLQAMMFVPPWSGSSGGQGTSFDDGGFYSDYLITDVETVHTTVPFVSDQMINTNFDLDISVCGRAAAANQVPPCGLAGDVSLENATVTVKVIGNFGTPIMLSGTGCGLEGNLACALQTDENGEVTFTVQLNKTGSYTFEVKTNFAPHLLVASTNQFIVRP